MSQSQTRGKVVKEMAEEEPQPDITPMIDVVFLLLIFFMCMKFKSFEKALDSELPAKDGITAGEIDPTEQLRVRIQLLPGETDKVQLVLDPMNEYFHVIPYRPGEAGKREMFNELAEQLRRGFPYIGDKIEVAPDERVPFDYVALTLDALHKGQSGVPLDERKQVTFMAAPPNPQ